MTDHDQKPIRVGLISLGCAKNLVDAEIMLGSLVQDGLEITNDPHSADVVIVNTCSFIDAAQEESVDAILESAGLRDQQNPSQGLVVSGCLSQRFRDELPALLPEVDAFMGIDQVAQVPRIVRQALALRRRKLESGAPLKRKNARAVVSKLAGSKPKPSSVQPLLEVHQRPEYIPDYATPRFRLTPRHFAYLKIAEGCNHPCSFCAIPRMRGTHRSRPQADLVAEATRLLADGVRELNLISQDTTFYGLDLRPERNGSIASPGKFRAAAQALPTGSTTLCTLLRELNGLPGDFWIRLLYTHPAHWTDELIETISQCPKVARYVDMPLQHIHGNMLERMRRETSSEYIVELIRKIRERIPGIAIRTTFIVGFPGETEACFEALLEFIRQTRFERLGIFTYSQEEGTRAARMMSQIPEEVKQERRDRAMAAQLEVARQISASQLGRQLKVLVEGQATPAQLQQANVSSWEHGLIRTGTTPAHTLQSPFLAARGEADAPDIDGRVYIHGRTVPGKFAPVRIVGHTDYDLIAEPLSGE
jgi:ribosomal protein S12 methylthiotransferase